MSKYMLFIIDAHCTVADFDSLLLSIVSLMPSNKFYLISMGAGSMYFFKIVPLNTVASYYSGFPLSLFLCVTLDRLIIILCN